MSSAPTRQGTSFPAGGFAQPAAAPATPTPTSFRKSRREKTSESDMGARALVVADQAVHLRGIDWVVEVLAVTRDAPAHLERAVLVDDVHRLHGPVAILALEAGEHVALVVELHVVGQVVHLDPRDPLATLEVARQLDDVGLVRHRDLVAAHARAHRRDVRPRRLPRAVMAVAAGHVELARVELVAERDRLDRTLAGADLD